MKRDELYLGVDLGGVNVRAAVVDATGHVLGQEKHRLLSKEPPQVAAPVLPASSVTSKSFPTGAIVPAGSGAASRPMRAGRISLPGLATTCASRWPQRALGVSAIPPSAASCSTSSASPTR